MSLPWVKVHTGLLSNKAWRRFSPQGKLTYYTCLQLAALQDQGDFSGRLEIPNLGPITLEEIAQETGLKLPAQEAAIAELIAAGFLLRDILNTIVVERFKEKAAPLASTKRTQEYRQRNARGTRGEREGNARGTGPEAEVEADSRIALLRNAATATKEWPTEPADLRSLAKPFVALFANCEDEEKREAHIDAYVPVLVAMQGRGLSIGEAWDTIKRCWESQRKKPLFKAHIKTAMNFLPARAPSKPSSPDYARLT